MTVEKSTIIAKINEIVNNFEDTEEAYDHALEYLDNVCECDEIDFSVVRVIETYLEKGDHPADGMARIYEHPLF